jgi:N-acetylmuramoyl-L-alanine amidase
MRTISLSLVVTTGLLALIAAGCRNAVDAPVQDSPLARAFADAARESGIPEEILLAIGFVETRWQMPDAREAAHGDEHGARGSVGMMGVVERADDARLTRAASALGVDLEEARTDAAVHVRVAAEALRQIAAGADKGGLPSSVQGWRDALAVYGADGDELAGAAYAHAVFDVIDRGAVGVASTGDTLRLAGHGKPSRGAKVQALVADADSELVDEWLPARTGHWHNGRSHAIDRIVIHTTEGSYAGAISWFRSANNPYNTSAHYVIRSSDGEITQMVAEEDTAYHCRDWNTRAIGIEHEAISAQASWFTDAMYAESAALVRDIALRQGIPMDRTHIVGHNEVPGNDHSDPGVHWDWGYYMDLIVSGQSVAPPNDPPNDAPSEPAPPAQDDCGGLDYFGQCSGDTLSWCDSGALYVVDCASDGNSCGWQDNVIGFNCMAVAQESAPEQPEEQPEEQEQPEDPCAGLDYYGVCDGETLVWCDGGALYSVDCGVDGDVCGWQDDVIGNNCLAAPEPIPPEEEEEEDPCGGVDYAGYCDGSTLVWCANETLYSYDCGGSSQTCGWQDDDVGNNCVD